METREVKDSQNAVPKMCRSCYLATTCVSPTMAKCTVCGESRKLTCSAARAPKVCRKCHLDRQAVLMAKIMRRKSSPSLRSRSPEEMA